MANHMKKSECKINGCRANKNSEEYIPYREFFADNPDRPQRKAGSMGRKENE